MKIFKSIVEVGNVTTQEYYLRFGDIGGFYEVSVMWFTIKSPSCTTKSIYVFFTPKVGACVKVKMASLHDALTLIRILGGDVK